jgi:hypothetical protein
MTEKYGNGSELEGELTVNKDDFELGTMDDELRVDGLCKKLLKRFYFQMLEDGLSPDQATQLAGGADYFIRDFVVAIKERNIFEEQEGLVRQFAGNWYIVNNLEPNVPELSRHLAGVRAFYRFLRSRELVSAQFLERIEEECDDTAYYEGRIESFWEITGDGFFAWERECSLKD